MIKSNIMVAICVLAAGGALTVSFFPLSSVENNNQDEILGDFKTTDTYIESVSNEQKDLEQQLSSGQINDAEYFLKLNETLSDENAVAVLKSSSLPLRFSYENSENLENTYYVLGAYGLSLVMGSFLWIPLFHFSNNKPQKKQDDDEIDYLSIDLC